MAICHIFCVILTLTNFMWYKFLLSAALFTPMTLLSQHSGRVFVDQNQNGIFDKGDKPKSNVMVSDGLNVSKTNSQGIFSLAGHDKQRFIFITTPSGYKTYNAHYQAIKDNGESYDFGIIPSSGVAKDGSHNFIQISDTEIREQQGHQEWISSVNDYAQNQNSAFIMHTGDICYPLGLDSHIKIMNTKNMNCPVYYAIGNHDLVAGEYGEKMFEDLYGPSWYSFDVGNVHYIVTPMLSGDYAPKYTKEDVYRWLKNDLANVDKDMATYIFSHDVGAHNTDKLVYAISPEESIDLETHNLKAWLYGHWHINHIARHGSAYSIGTSTPIRGGIDHTTSSFRVMHIDQKGDFTSELRYPYIRSMEIASINIDQSPVTAAHTTPLSVNLYNSTSPVTKVLYSAKVNGKKSDIAGSLSKQTDWNWAGDIALGSAKSGDAILVSVTAHFANGEVLKSSKNFIIDSKSVSINASENWTNLLQNSAHAPSLGDTLKGNLALKWVKNVGSNIFMCSPIVYNGNTYVASVDENMSGKAAVTAFDSQTGAQKWKFMTEHSVRNTIVAQDGYIFAQDVLGWLYALDANSGKLAWKKRLSVAAVLPPLIEGLAANDGVVYAGTGLGLTAVDAKSGKVLWVNKDWRQGESCTSTISVGEDVLVMGTQWGALYANCAQTGKMLWKASDNGLRNRASSPAFYDGLLYLISQNSLFIIEPKSGSVIVRKQLDYSVDVTSTPLVTDSEIIFGTASSGVVALDKATLSQKWNFRTGEALIYTAPYITHPAAMIESSPVLSGDRIYIGGVDGVLYVLDRTSGAMQWNIPLGAPIFSSPSISGNALFVSDYGGNVYGFVAN